jgi:ubiquinone/menaquinone biosynthesis C-methylase UbiE
MRVEQNMCLKKGKINACLIEIGCGIGTDTMNFARAGAQVTAVDISDKSLELAKQRAEIHGLTANIDFYQANAEKLASVVPVAPFDRVYKPEGSVIVIC